MAVLAKPTCTVYNNRQAWGCAKYNIGFSQRGYVRLVTVKASEELRNCSFWHLAPRVHFLKKQCYRLYVVVLCLLASITYENIANKNLKNAEISKIYFQQQNIYVYTMQQKKITDKGVHVSDKLTKRKMFTNPVKLKL